MYEPNDPERDFIYHLSASDNEISEIIEPECGGRMLKAATRFDRFHRGATKVRLDRARPTLLVLIQRRLRANEERSLNSRDSGLHQKLLRASVPQHDDGGTHTFSDPSAK